MEPARYFPLKPTPFRFQAGLLPFGTDFGHGAVDRQFFQVDDQLDHYLAEKRRVDPSRHRVLERNDDERRVHRRVLSWIGETLREEHPDLFPDPPRTYRDIGASVQEDLVVLHRRGDGSDAAIAVEVCFPSDWRPERIIDTDFRFIHGPVPGFADTDTQARALAGAMIDRGPHVRFVWTLKADSFLDHHPEQGGHGTWQDARDGFLRVERQVTVPFADIDASLFLIRTYLYPFTSLTAEQRQAVLQSVETMPEAAARYKGLVEDRGIILALLRGAR